MPDERKVVMVLGGTGMVGQAIKWAVEQRGHRDNEEWLFLGSKDGDLR